MTTEPMTTEPMTTDPMPARPATAADAPVEPRWVIRTFWVLHRALVAVTRGRLGYRPATAQRWGMLRLHTVGRRSGAERLAILGYIEDGPNLVTLAMNGWAEGVPAWWRNLQAHPDATVRTVEGERPVRAREAHGEDSGREAAEHEDEGIALEEFGHQVPVTE